VAWIFFFSFFSLFSIAHTILFGTWNFWERHMINEWSNYLVDGKNMLCVTLNVRVSSLFVGVRVSWSWVHDENVNMGHNNFGKLNAQTSSIWLRFWIWISCHIALVGIHNHWGSFLF
jgi:hypothetical protein